MKGVVIYDTTHGNTQRIAETISETLKESGLEVDIFYVKDVKKEKVEKFCEDAMKKHPNRVYKIATARSNNPGMIAVYYREK